MSNAFANGSFQRGSSVEFDDNLSDNVERHHELDCETRSFNHIKPKSKFQKAVDRVSRAKVLASFASSCSYGDMKDAMSEPEIHDQPIEDNISFDNRSDHDLNPRHTITLGGPE